AVVAVVRGGGLCFQELGDRAGGDGEGTAHVTRGPPVVTHRRFGAQCHAAADPHHLHEPTERGEVEQRHVGQEAVVRSDPAAVAEPGGEPTQVRVRGDRHLGGAGGTGSHQ